MTLSSFWHQIHYSFFRVLHSGTYTLCETVVLLLVALGFLVIGASRWVEFLDFGFSKWRRSVLIVLHLAGCLTLSLAFVIVAIDLDKKLSNVGLGLLASAIVLLFPIHIYLGLLRRIRQGPRTPYIIHLPKLKFWKR